MYVSGTEPLPGVQHAANTNSDVPLILAVCLVLNLNYEYVSVKTFTFIQALVSALS